jgi:hypothetical protein
MLAKGALVLVIYVQEVPQIAYLVFQDTYYLVILAKSAIVLVLSALEV